MEAFDCAKDEMGNVHIDAWRQRAYSMAISPTNTPSANQQAFLRARNKLLDLRLIDETPEPGVYRLAEGDNADIGGDPESDELQ